MISIAAYEAAFEQYDYSLASAIAMIMGFVQLVIVAAVLGAAQPVLSRPGRRRERDERAATSDWLDRAWRGLLLGLMTLFVVNIGLMIAAVATSSFARRWLGTWLPEGWTTTWYTAAWKEFQLGDVLLVTVEVVFAVVLPVAADRRAGRLHAGAPQFPRQARADAAVPAAADGAADHLRHSARDGALQGASRAARSGA